MHTRNTRHGIPLSPRQFQVLTGIWNGYTSHEIGQQLGISKKTVEVHRAILHEILGTHNTAQLFRAAAQAGLLNLKGA